MNPTYSNALSEAKKELADIQPRINDLLARKQLLEGLISQLQKVVYPFAPDSQTLFGTVPAGSTDTPDQEGPDENGDDGPYLWQQLRAIMNGQTAWTMAEAGMRLEHSGVNLGPNRPQKIRNSIIRHPETFERLPDGRYIVRPALTVPAKGIDYSQF